MIYSVINQTRFLFDSVAVYFSCGKDSIVTLDLCCKNFKHVTAFFMYLVEGLSFQEQYISMCERKYGITIYRIPHWQLSNFYQTSTYRPDSKKSIKTPTVKISDVDYFIRNTANVLWIASGEKACDSVERNGMIRSCHGIDIKRNRFYPIAYFTDPVIYNYMKINRLPLPPDYGLFGRSFGRLHEEELFGIKSKYPEDYNKIIKVFPYAESAIKRAEYRSIPLSEV